MKTYLVRYKPTGDLYGKKYQKIDTSTTKMAKPFSSIRNAKLGGQHIWVKDPTKPYVYSGVTYYQNVHPPKSDIEIVEVDIQIVVTKVVG
jgi:hypothetical protein